MKKKLFKPLFIGIFVFSMGVIANAQEKKSTSGKVAKTAVIVVGQTAKITVKAVQVIAPIAYKLTEKTTVIGFKVTQTLIEKSLPVARKLIVTYLRTKLPL